MCINCYSINKISNSFVQNIHKIYKCWIHLKKSPIIFLEDSLYHSKRTKKRLLCPSWLLSTMENHLFPSNTTLRSTPCVNSIIARNVTFVNTSSQSRYFSRGILGQLPYQWPQQQINRGQLTDCPISINPTSNIFVFRSTISIEAQTLDRDRWSHRVASWAHWHRQLPIICR